MTLGDKIKKYRILRQLTQKELGEKVGFSSKTADSRIRKYKKNIMAPKTEIRNKLADALDADLSALSDINIQTYEDVMHTLFLFEEEFDMDIDRTEEKTTLSFDNHNKKIAPLITYLYTWYCNKKDLSNQVTADLEQYESWKGRFPKDINEYWTEQKNKIESLYTPYIKELSKANKPIYTISEFIELLRVLIKHNLSIEVGIKSYGAGDSALVLNFFVKEILNTDILAVNRDFAKFLYTIFLDRVSLSIKNGWVDENGRVFIYYSVINICEILNCGTQKACKLLDELETFGALERRRQGLGKPNRIYLKKVF